MIVYKATNKINGKVYIGATTKSIKERIAHHIKDAFRNDRPKRYFQEALMKYGPDNFQFEEIDHAKTKEEMYQKEDEWIAHYNSTDDRYGYNLNTGGISGKKQESTKHKIGITTSKRWEDPDIASRMLRGLRKGSEVWKNECHNNRVKFICPQCGDVLFLSQYEAKTKRYCSIDCAKEAGIYKKIALKATERAGVLAHEKNLKRKRDIADFITDWVINNSDYVMSCKYNNITNHFKPLTNLLRDKYGIFDLRSIYICFNAVNKKDLLRILQNIASEENIC
jgi:group I intron endonuclease